MARIKQVGGKRPPAGASTAVLPKTTTENHCCICYKIYSKGKGKGKTPQLAAKATRKEPVSTAAKKKRRYKPGSKFNNCHINCYIISLTY
jgi:hypothetical protein